MNVINGFEFPERGNAAECEMWSPAIVRRPLNRKVLTVAKTRIEGAWAAYCDAVPGVDHAEESVAVCEDGDKLPERIARAIFPQLDDVPYAV